ncbi:hypothetical protein SKTS_12800 [Sulfurimicrobium lacus]|uniref:HDOD domain-containing protein n=1 Tax=Sulfurimicrobium lacus TaxID=2715678 RepID=A0A6F8V9Q8_9PROT|nr:HDOD domain-containing protein [Sulfurimicrobium lacus]BCB26394.1 hypothetical protein SKTS_12800 [Sulfurimicrobium lacus]
MTPATEQIFSHAIRLPQVPQVMQEVVNSLRNEDISVSQLADLVGKDQVIAAKVLRLANSSYYGARHNVASIGDAVQLIGLNAFRNLVIASSLIGAFPKVEGFDLPAFWRSSMLVANLAHIIGRDLDVDRATLFSAGLMHGIGQLLIYLCLPDSARNLAEACKGKPLKELRAIEQHHFGMNHFEVGMELARRWNFPESIQFAIGHYDEAANDELPAQIVHAGVKIAHGIQMGSTFSEMLNTLPPDLAERLGIDHDWLEEQGDVFDALIDEAASLS